MDWNTKSGYQEIICSEASKDKTEKFLKMVFFDSGTSVIKRPWVKPKILDLRRKTLDKIFQTIDSFTKAYPHKKFTPRAYLKSVDTSLYELINDLMAVYKEVSNEKILDHDVSTILKEMFDKEYKNFKYGDYGAPSQSQLKKLVLNKRDIRELGGQKHAACEALIEAFQLNFSKSTLVTYSKQYFDFQDSKKSFAELRTKSQESLQLDNYSHKSYIIWILRTFCDFSKEQAESIYSISNHYPNKKIISGYPFQKDISEIFLEEKEIHKSPQEIENIEKLISDSKED